jgi:hypothetical protein
LNPLSRINRSRITHTPNYFSNPVLDNESSQIISDCDFFVDKKLIFNLDLFHSELEMSQVKRTRSATRRLVKKPRVIQEDGIIVLSRIEFHKITIGANVFAIPVKSIIITVEQFCEFLYGSIDEIKINDVILIRRTVDGYIVRFVSLDKNYTIGESESIRIFLQILNIKI